MNTFPAPPEIDEDKIFQTLLARINFAPKDYAISDITVKDCPDNGLYKFFVKLVTRKCDKADLKNLEEVKHLYDIPALKYTVTVEEFRNPEIPMRSAEQQIIRQFNDLELLQKEEPTILNEFWIYVSMQNPIINCMLFGRFFKEVRFQKIPNGIDGCIGRGYRLVIVNSPTDDIQKEFTVDVWQIDKEASPTFPDKEIFSTHIQISAKVLQGATTTSPMDEIDETPSIFENEPLGRVSEYLLTFLFFNATLRTETLEINLHNRDSRHIYTILYGRCIEFNTHAEGKIQAQKLVFYPAEHDQLALLVDFLPKLDDDKLCQLEIVWNGPKCIITDEKSFLNNFNPPKPIPSLHLKGKMGTEPDHLNVFFRKFLNVVIEEPILVTADRFLAMRNQLDMIYSLVVPQPPELLVVPQPSHTFKPSTDKDDKRVFTRMKSESNSEVMKSVVDFKKKRSDRRAHHPSILSMSSFPAKSILGFLIISMLISPSSGWFYSRCTWRPTVYCGSSTNCLPGEIRIGPSAYSTQEEFDLEENVEKEAHYLLTTIVKPIRKWNGSCEKYGENNPSTGIFCCCHSIYTTFALYPEPLNFGDEPENSGDNVQDT